MRPAARPVESQSTNTASTTHGTAHTTVPTQIHVVVQPPTPAKEPVPSTTPIRIEPRATLLHFPFFASAGVVLAGSLIAGEGYHRIGFGVLAIGLVSLLIVIGRSLYTGK